jgi:hypothetical protein
MMDNNEKDESFQDKIPSFVNDEIKDHSVREEDNDRLLNNLSHLGNILSDTMEGMLVGSTCSSWGIYSFFI